jgi:transcriptional regulator of acetoin/glycerol metabolism
MLVQHDWPGNVRQLEHALLNAWVLSEDGILDVEDFETLADRPSPPPAGSPQAPADNIESAERRDILEALRAARWNKTAAARALGIPRRTFYRRLKKHGLLK